MSQRGTRRMREVTTIRAVCLADPASLLSAIIHRPLHIVVIPAVSSVTYNSLSLSYNSALASAALHYLYLLKL